MLNNSRAYELVDGNLPILEMLVGLPRCGKSTYAKNTVHPIVNPDAIRLALHGNAFIPQAEAMVWAMAKYMIDSLFLAGHRKVILDATNITEERRNNFKSKNYIRHFIQFPFDVELSKARAIDTEKSFLLPVIEKMAEQYQPVSIDELLEYEQAWILIEGIGAKRVFQKQPDPINMQEAY